MTFTNHAVTGALVAAAINYPPISLPAALASHFVIDAIPHWKYRPPVRYKKPIVVIDALAVICLLALFSATVNASAWLIILGGLLGSLPDVMWLPAGLKNKDVPMNRPTILHYLRRFHTWVQWNEKPFGKYIEVVWFGVTLVLIYQIHH